MKGKMLVTFFWLVYIMHTTCTVHAFIVNAYYMYRINAYYMYRMHTTCTELMHTTCTVHDIIVNAYYMYST